MPIVDKHPHGNVTWIDLMSGDPEGSRTFYGSLFDWTFEVGGPETGHYAMCKLGGKNVAGIGGKPPGAPIPTAWTPYLATDDLDKTLAAVAEAGGAVMMPAMDVMDQGRMAIIADSTGGALGLWQAKQHNGMQRLAEPGSFAWTELNTRDMKKASDFFVKVFGYEAKKLEGPMEYTTLHQPGEQTPVAGVLQMDQNWPKEVPPHWMVYFAVTDVDAALETVAKLGGKTCVPPFDSPYGRISVIEDPQGGMVSLIKPTQPA
jgi:uncharacterized protein